MTDDVIPLPLTARTVHLCVDMQRIFSSEGPWATPWMERVLPVVLATSRRFPERTVFTRFITPNHPSDMPGTWRLYYEKWRETTRDQMDVRLLQLMPDLAKLAPPAMVIDKMRYSAFFEPFLLQHLRARQADGLVVTGSETDVCVLATIMSAVDHGYRVILVRDGV
jgi:nicotinamidase-related amidase